MARFFRNPGRMAERGGQRTRDSGLGGAALQTRTHQDDAQAPEVAGLVVAVVVQELGRGVVQSEAGRLEGLVVRRLEAGKPEVNDFNVQVVIFIREQQILQGTNTDISLSLKCHGTW